MSKQLGAYRKTLAISDHCHLTVFLLHFQHHDEVGGRLYSIPLD